MGCFKGSEYKTKAVSPEQEEMYKKMAGIFMGSMQQPYQSRPMISAQANPGQMAGMDYIQRQLGYGGYEQPGFMYAGSQNVNMPQQTNPNVVSSTNLRDPNRRNPYQAPWLT
jgi:hypothetical protein